MREQQLAPTRTSLIRLLQEPISGRKGARTVGPAWEEFYAIYYPVILNWCRKFGLQAADAEDVAQGVVLKLFKITLKSYRPGDGRFRNWLGGVVRNAVLDFLRGLGRRPHMLENAQLEALQSSASLAALQEEVDLSLPTEFELCQEIVARVQARVQPHTWEAFARHKLHGKSAADVAAELGFTEDAVYVACNRVQKMLREEKTKLLHDNQNQGA